MIWIDYSKFCHCLNLLFNQHSDSTHDLFTEMFRETYFYSQHAIHVYFFRAEKFKQSRIYFRAQNLNNPKLTFERKILKDKNWLSSRKIQKDKNWFSSRRIKTVKNCFSSRKSEPVKNLIRKICNCFGFN